MCELTVASLLSLDDAGDGGDDGGARLAECIASMDTPDPGDEVARKEMKKELAQLIHELPEKERHVIVLYYSEGLYLKEIGAALGVTESRVSQIHSRALFRLNNGLTKTNLEKSGA